LFWTQRLEREFERFSTKSQFSVPITVTNIAETNVIHPARTRITTTTITTITTITNIPIAAITTHPSLCSLKKL
jgi:hypothetical protein